MAPIKHLQIDPEKMICPVCHQIYGAKKKVSIEVSSTNIVVSILLSLAILVFESYYRLSPKEPLYSWLARESEDPSTDWTAFIVAVAILSIAISFVGTILKSFRKCAYCHAALNS